MSASPEHEKPSGTPTSSDWRRSIREVGPYLGLGLQLAVTMAAFVGLGYLADLTFSTAPWLTLVGSALGLVAVFVLLIRMTQGPD